jgi:delta 1-pyrroline-5-carboxylate dehydrogenase
VVESVYEQFVEAVKRETAAFRIGYTADIHTDYNCGPITFPRQVEIIASHIEDAQQKGATLLAGGGRGDMFYQPTVLTNVTHDMLVMREETFGPVLPIMKVRDEAEAIQKANDSAYGLCAYVWSRDLARAEQVGRQIEAGTVVVNDAMAHYAVSQLPFGGVKKSGTGRIHGPEEVLQVAQLKGYAIGQAPHPLDIATYLRAPNRYREMKALLKLVFGSWRQRGEIVHDWRALTPSHSTETEAPPSPATAPALGKVLAGVGVAAAVVFAVVKVARKAST